MSNFFNELKRRNVFKVAIAYIVGGWALSQGIAQVFPVFDVPNWIIRLIVLLIIIGLPVALVLAWAFEITPQGIRSTEAADAMPHAGRQKKHAWIYVVVAGGLASIGLFLLGRYTASQKQTEAALVPEKSIAVLPFVNMSGSAANNDFSDGITEEILNALSQIPSLKVAARTSAFQFKGKNIDLRQVGEALGVNYVLEGSVQRAGDDVRITAQLVDTHSDYHLWSEKYDRKMTSLFAIEDEISRAITGQMQVTLDGNRQEVLVKGATADPTAHEFYLEGLAQITERGAVLNSAVQLFNQAIALDPKYAVAWAGLAQAYELLPWYELAPAQTALAQAKQAAEQALALDPQLAEAHTAIANVLRDEADFNRAEKEYEAAVALNPGSAETRNQFAQMLTDVGLFERAIEQEHTAVGLDPLAPNPRYMLGYMLCCLHRYDEAFAEEKIAVSHNPKYPPARFWLAYLYLYTSKYDEAAKEAREAALQAGEDPAFLDSLVRAVGNPSERSAALRLLDSHKLGKDGLGGIADAFWSIMLGSREKALEKLQDWAAPSRRSERFLGRNVFWTPAFDPLRKDARFEAIMRSVDIPVGSADSGHKL